MGQYRAVWKGDLSFGLLNISVKLIKGYNDNDVSFHLVHRGCNARVRYKYECENGHRIEDRSDIVKGFDTIDGMVLFDDGEIKAIQVPSNHSVELLKTGPMPDPALIDDIYWLEPELKAERAANLFREAMLRMNVAVYGTITLRTREQPCVIWLRENQLALSTLRYVDDLRSMPILDRLPVEDAELKLAMNFMTMMSKETPSSDRYREAVINAAEAKLKGSKVAVAKIVADHPPIDIMEALRASISEAKKSKPSKESSKPKAKAKQKAS